MKPAFRWVTIGHGIVKEVEGATLLIRSHNGETRVRRATGAGNRELATPLVGCKVDLIQKKGDRLFGEILAEDSA